MDEIHQSINMFICIAANKQNSSEVLTAKQMSFELFLRMCQCKAKKSVVIDQGANYKKILRLSYDVIITYDNRKLLSHRKIILRFFCN